MPRANDHRLQAAAEATIAAAAAGRSARKVLQRLRPQICRQIAEDGRERALLTLWGRSLNFDENARQTIVHPQILKAIGDLAGVAMQGRVVHAGLQHTYGYLFSVIETPHGLKRERWTSTIMERGLDIEPSLFSDQPAEGTLLGNVTWLLSQIVFAGRLPRGLQRPPATVARQLVDYPYDRLEVQRVFERVELAPLRTITLITDLVRFPRRQKSEPTTLLVYSVQTGSAPRPKLITAFPMRQEAVEELLAAARPAGKAPIRARYNAAIRGLTGREIAGTRWLKTESPPGTKSRTAR